MLGRESAAAAAAAASLLSTEFICTDLAGIIATRLERTLLMVAMCKITLQNML